MANFGNYGSGKFNKILAKDITVSDDFSLTDDLTVGGDFTLTGALAVTGAATMDTSLNFGTLSSSTQTGITLVAAAPTILNVFADDNNTTLTNEVYGLIRGRAMLFKDAAGITLTSVKGQIKGAAGVDFGTGVYSGVQGYIELMGTHSASASGKLSALQGEIEITTALTSTGASA